MADRPAVSVVVPFLGGHQAAASLAATLETLEIRPGDELIVADNTVRGAFAEAVRSDRIDVVRSTGQHSSYRSRNVGASHARNAWFLFVDADCRPHPELIDRYFGKPIGERTGAVSGPVLPLPKGDGAMVRYESSRSANKQAPHMSNPYKPFGVTANLLVRRAAWEDVGGFQEGIRSAGDADFCWRMQDAGWSLEYVADAEVRHLLREDLRAYLRLHLRYGAGRRWLHLRHPSAPIKPMPQLAFRKLAGALVWPLVGRVERGLFSAIDAAVIVSETVGYTLGNAGPQWQRDRDPERPRVELMADRFPKPSETFIANEAKALVDLEVSVGVSARSRPERPALGGTWGLDVRHLEDAGILREALDLAWLVSRHPARCAADLVSRRRWRREERVAPLRELAPLARRLAEGRVGHMHVHFARRAALDALRLNRLLGIPYSVTAHAWDIFRQRCNLAEKIERSAFATTGCDYNVRHLEGMVSRGSRGKIQKIVMGVDPGEFRRTAPYDGDGTVIAIGRLVAKKGFEHLIDATARLREFEGLREVVIVGDGELREELAERARALGLDRVVRFEGARRHHEVRSLIEEAALLAMPAVVAPDGDRDSMPVVVKEALAMGVPVVASDEVGLPEVVREDWGRLVPPGDAEALAAEIRELLELPPEVRAEMGEAGREFVLREFGLADQTRKLVDLIERA